MSEAAFAERFGGMACPSKHLAETGDIRGDVEIVPDFVCAPAGAGAYAHPGYGS